MACHHRTGPKTQQERDIKPGSMQIPEASPPALSIINADFLKTAKIDLPKGIFHSYSATVDSILFSINSRKEEERELLPIHKEACSLPHSIAPTFPSRTSMSIVSHVFTNLCQEQRHTASYLKPLKHIPPGAAAPGSAC